MVVAGHGVLSVLSPLSVWISADFGVVHTTHIHILALSHLVMTNIIHIHLSTLKRQKSSLNQYLDIVSSSDSFKNFLDLT